MTDQERFEQMIQPLIWKPAQVAQLQKVEDLGDIDNIPEVYSRQMAVAAAKGEDKLLVEVLQEHLGRHVLTDDFKDCQVIFREGCPNEYVFAHLGVALGNVRREMELKYGYTDISDPTKNLFSIKHTVTFRPIKAK